MTEEYDEQWPVLDEPEAVEAEYPEKKRRPGWFVPVLIGLIAVLFLCTCIVCGAAATIFITSRSQATAVPLPPAATVPAMTLAPTSTPGPVYIRIEQPVQGAVVDISRPLVIGGMGAGLPEGNVVVQVLDAAGNVLAQQPTILQGPDVGTGGEGTWSLELPVEATPGMAGTIYAFSPSPLDNSIVASDQVQVSLGQTPAVEAYIRVDEPAEGVVVDPAQPVMVRGSGAGLPEGNVIVQAHDAGGNVLGTATTVLQGPDVGTGGEGTWAVELSVAVSGSADGTIVAFSTSPLDGSLVASDGVPVVYQGQAPDSGLEGHDWLLQPQTGSTQITIRFEAGKVSGSSGCNTYFGSYTATPGQANNTITISDLATTRMACEQDVMDQEQAYLAALETAAGYAVEGDTLSIYHPGGTLTFTAIVASPSQ